MPIRYDYIGLDSLDSSSEEAEDAPVSDVEDLSAEHDLDDMTPKDYWFGKKYFECILALDILHRTPLSGVIPALDWQLETSMHRYPYRQAWEHLQGEGVTGLRRNSGGREEDSRAALLSLVGAVICRSPKTVKCVLLTGLRKFSTRQSSDESFRAQVSEDRKNENAQRALREPKTLTPNLPGPRTARFTTLLKESGDQIGQIPRYSSQTVSLEPPLFKETVYFQDFTFEGTGRSKKEAKHQASKDACEFLGFSEC